MLNRWNFVKKIDTTAIYKLYATKAKQHWKDAPLVCTSPSNNRVVSPVKICLKRYILFCQINPNQLELKSLRKQKKLTYVCKKRELYDLL